MSYQAVLFDLDGTVTDSAPGITNSAAYALEKFGIHVEDKDTLRPFIGPPLLDSFARFYGFTAEQSRQAVVYYREYYRDRGIYENAVYDGMEELLQSLRAAGKILLATSKPEQFAIQILEHFHIAEYFDVIAGATMDETRTDKADVIAYALEKAGIADPSAAVMVGDREYDVLGAKAFGMDCIGVLYGFGSRAELEQAGARYLAETVEEIGTFV